MSVWFGQMALRWLYMSISIIQTMVLTQITHIRSYLNLVWKPSRTTLKIFRVYFFQTKRRYTKEAKSLYHLPDSGNADLCTQWRLFRLFLLKANTINCQSLFVQCIKWDKHWCPNPYRSLVPNVFKSKLRLTHKNVKMCASLSFFSILDIHASRKISLFSSLHSHKFFTIWIGIPILERF